MAPINGRAARPTAHIRRMGLINSGMFDLLDVNLDVPAVHLVGANNVGKTSLIEALQFLYYANLNDMRFGKTLTESVAFYFRLEGSYILFEVRTLQGGIRTIGIYGTGTSPSIERFVFDGPFAIDDFLDAERKPLPLNIARNKLFERRYAVFGRVDEYERALNGINSDERLNVPLFELSTANYRLLSTLLRGLLRLDRVRANEVRDFIIDIVSASSNVQTTIAIARDYEAKYADIRTMRAKLDDLKALQPVIQVWAQLQKRSAELDELRLRNRQTLHAVFARYHAQLVAEISAIAAEEAQVEAAAATVQNEADRVLTARTQRDVQFSQLRERVARRDKLRAELSGFDHAAGQQALEALYNRKATLSALLAQSAARPLSDLQRRLRDNQDELARVERQIASRTVGTLWESEVYSAEQQALLRFVVSQQLHGLPHDLLEDARAFGAWSRRVLAMFRVTGDGTLVGAGLRVPRSKWYRTIDDAEPLEAQRERLLAARQRLQEQISVATDRAATERALADLENQIAQTQERLNKLRRLAELMEEIGSDDAVASQLAAWQAAIDDLDRQKRVLDQRRDEQATAQKTLFARRTRLEQRLGQINHSRPTDQPADPPMTEEAVGLAADDLPDAYRRLAERVRDNDREFNNVQAALVDPRTQLEARYDREAPDSSFDAWLTRQEDIGAEVTRVEALLQDNLTNLLTVVKRELSNLIEGYNRVDSQIADLNRLLRGVRISNLTRVQLQIEESELVNAIRQTTSGRTLFDPQPALPPAEAEQLVEAYLQRLRGFGNQLSLTDLIKLSFDIQFEHTANRTIHEHEIDRFESNGTRIAVKIVLYLGLIRLLQQSGRQPGSTRIPFFLDEVGSLDTHNLGQLLEYCEAHAFLPIFASPSVRPDLSHSYFLQRMGERSAHVNTLILTPLAAGSAANGQG